MVLVRYPFMGRLMLSGLCSTSVVAPWHANPQPDIEDNLPESGLRGVGVRM